ncbi:MAG: toxin [Actinomycetota bacterium]|nr:toxin [Actinomycetota bacterium]
MDTRCLICTSPPASTTGATTLDDEAVLYAARHVLTSRPLDEDDDPRRWLMIATDPAGRLLEIITLIYDDGGELIIHAMKARTQYLNEL